VVERPHPEDHGVPADPGANDTYLTPNITFRVGGGAGYFWGGAWGDIQPAPGRYYPK